MSNKKFDEWAFDQTVTKGGTIFGCKDKSGVNVGFVNTGTGEYFSLSDGGEWISVDDELPEQDQSVIAYGVYDGEINGLGTLMVGSGVYVSNRVVQMEADAYYANLINITHWQPLPQPPQQPTGKG